MKTSFFLLAFWVSSLAAIDANAGCGLLRRGGCSDPSGAGAGGAHCSACSGGYAASPGRMANATYAPTISCSPNATPSAMGYATGSTGCAGCTTTASTCAGQAYSAGPAYSISGLSQGSICAAPTIAATMTIPTQQTELLDCGPVTTYRVVMEPQYTTETRYVESTEYQNEVRTRVRTVARQVPVEVQDYRTTTVMVPKSEVKVVEYQVLVPQTSEKTVEIVENIPVWNEVTEEYTVQVPTVVEVPEEYTVRVPTLRNEEFVYTVYVPTTQTQTRMHTYTNAVPVTKSRTIQVSRPVTRTQMVTKDYGHWEDRVEEVTVMHNVANGGCVPAANISGCGSVAYSTGFGQGTGCGQAVGVYGAGCGRSYGSSTVYGGVYGGGCGSNVIYGGGCGSSTVYTGGCGSGGGTGCGSVYGGGCGQVSMATTSVPTTQLVTRRVWVPNVTTEQVAVVENVLETQEVTYTDFEQKSEQVPYECTYIVYAPEQRTGNRQVVDYVQETRSRSRKVVQYNDEARTRVRKELSYKQESRTQTIPVVTYTTETRTKEVAFTVNVPETKVEPITTTRYETVQEEITEDYTVRVPVVTPRETQVQVCRMVPKLVPVTIYPCSSAGQQLMQGSSCNDCGGCNACGSTGGMMSPMAPTLAPAAPVGTSISTGIGCSNCSGFDRAGAICSGTCGR